MVFNSAVFLFFLAVVLTVYWSLQRFKNGLRYQNIFLLLASYFFYGYWDWVFLGLIWVSTMVDYVIARQLDVTEEQGRRKILLTVSVLVNLGLLGTFKYFDFFAGSFIGAVRTFDPAFMAAGESSLLLQVILPVGISFYTFQTMSYTIDVYRREIKAERNLIDFGLFVCFFPQLVAGPIERASELLPQFKERRVFDFENVQKGVWLILLGLFMKVYVADNLGVLVDQVFLANKHIYLAKPELAMGHGGFQILAACFAFTIQIYGDFAGYSSIALGSALLLGIRLTLNFDTPFYSQSPIEFWRRWHITLNRWIVDYIYIPLGGSRIGEFNRQRNLFVAFALTGLWHGANWTFVLWGILHGGFVVLQGVLGPRLPRLPEGANRYLKGLVMGSKMGATWIFMFVSMLLFRTYDIEHAWILLKDLLDFPWNMSGSVNGVLPAGRYISDILSVCILLLTLDFVTYKRKDHFWVFKRALWLRVSIYSVLLLLVVLRGYWGKDVIYFAF